MTTVSIRQPIWKDYTVGIAEDKINSDGCLIKILYTDRQGDRVFPHNYFISYEKSLTYPITSVKHHKLRMIPIKDLEVKLSREGK
jgi:hypothetical protein